MGMLKTTGRLLAARWPALLAWYCGGQLAGFWLLTLASFVGAYTAVGGILILCLSIVARLCGYVGMLLSLRSGLRTLQGLDPLPQEREARWRRFVDAFMAGVLPFLAFYWAWDYLNKDFIAYNRLAMSVWTSRMVLESPTEQLGTRQGLVDDFGISAVPIAIGVTAFVLRWLYKRYKDRLPGWTGLIAVYLEAVWIFVTVMIVDAALEGGKAWVDSRQGAVWLADAKDNVAAWFAPLGWAWSGVEWLIAALGAVFLLPMAWLAIAGVIYGQSISPAALTFSGRRFDKARARYSATPERVRRRLADVWGQATGRFVPLGRAFLLMFRAGPVFLGAYVLLYAALGLLQGWIGYLVARMWGPQDLATFWLWVSPALAMVPLVVCEPLRVALVAAAYDDTLSRVVEQVAEEVSEEGEQDKDEQVAPREASREVPPGGGVSAGEVKPEDR